jgi:DNA adenine methylase
MQKPFLKWAGNKFKILPLLIEHLGPHERLVEPFMGSGVFSLNTTKKYLGADLNSDLISIFDCLKDNPDNFIEYAKSFFTMEYVGEKSFYELREI